MKNTINLGLRRISPRYLGRVVMLNGQELSFGNCDTVRLSRKLGYDLTLKELMEIPANIQITEDEFSTRIHTPTIIDLDPEWAELGIIIMDPTEFFPKGYTSDEYILAMRKAVKQDPRLRINPKYAEEPEFDVDLYIEYKAIDVIYSHIGPFEFFVKFFGKTFGDIVLQVDQLSKDLEDKALQILKGNI